jgi:DNA-binding NtrC family response regulator
MGILIIDDEIAICRALAELLVGEGYECVYETDAAGALMAAPRAAVILLDLKIPGVKGLELLDEVLRRNARTPVIMITAHSTVEIAVEAMKRGAFDFIVKPPDREDLLTTIDKALRVSDADADRGDLCLDLPDEVVFRDDRSKELLKQIERVARTDLPVLLEGETGVGKEVFARLVLQWSPRAEEPFVRINCAAIPETLFESELFGHEKGAFTGATVTKPGRVELADRGTLFLDEIGELPLTSQAKLLQFLQDHTFERVGGVRTLSSDIRLICATNRDLHECIAEKTFREDLYFRVSGLPVRIPPLRERRVDILALAEHFVRRFSQRFMKEISLGDEARDAICAHDWPGNVRELEHALARAAAMTSGPVLMPHDVLPERAATPSGGLREQRREFERVQVLQALDETGGNRTRAAEILGISRRMLQKKLKAFGINRDS